MVSSNRFARVCLMLSLWCVLSNLSAAALQVTAVSTQIELGKPLWLTLSSDQTKVSLDTIDFSPWQQDFVIPRQTDMSIVDNKHSQHMRVQLYPLRKGELNLPALSFLNQRSNELSIDILEARDAKSKAPIDFTYKISTRAPWQQQQVVVSCAITTRDAYVVFTQPTERITGVQLLPMQVHQHEVHESLEPQTRYQLGWVLIPALAGKQQMQLPPIQYVRDGVVTHQFYVPSLTLEVQALPSWLPGTIPVGTLKVVNYHLSSKWLSTSVLSQVQLQLQLEGMATDAIPSFAQQLRSDSAVQFYSAQQKMLTSIDSHGIGHQLHYDIPAVAKHIGFYRLPDLRLQYFDPVSGTLKTERVPGGSVVILNAWLKALILICLFMLMAWLLRTLTRWLTWYWRRYLMYQQAMQLLHQSNSVPAIRQVMQVIARAEGWSTNLTYRQWQVRMQTLAPVAKELAVTNLNAISYGKVKGSITDTAQVLESICRHRRLAFW